MGYYHYYEHPKWHHVQPLYGIRTHRYKLIHFYYNVDIWELYDLKKDPNEFSNIYEKHKNKALVQGLKNKHLELQRQYGDNIPSEEMR